tara:strand:- start:1641 stop:1856 length:216 start_codon:yes stop_codon:yes gene_type:complete
LLVKIFISIIKGYQYALSPFMGFNCRFTPTCSQYSIDALRLHGSISGSYLILKRIIKCNPCGGYGEDPVPK